MKPKNLLDGICIELNAASIAPVKLIIHVKIISGQYLPKPSVASKLSDDVVDPYVILESVGYPCDSKKERTATVKNNGRRIFVFFFFYSQISYEIFIFIIFK